MPLNIYLYNLFFRSHQRYSQDTEYYIKRNLYNNKTKRVHIILINEEFMFIVTAVHNSCFKGRGHIINIGWNRFHIILFPAFRLKFKTRFYLKLQFTFFLLFFYCVLSRVKFVFEVHHLINGGGTRVSSFFLHYDKHVWKANEICHGFFCCW